MTDQPSVDVAFGGKADFGRNSPRKELWRVASADLNLPPESAKRLIWFLAGLRIGRSAVLAWDPRRFLAPYAERFVDEYADYIRRDFPGREFLKRAPPLPRPKAQIGDAAR
jgi:hypothetical protein